MRRCALFLWILLLVPTLVGAGKVTVDFDSAFDFPAARTVSWGEGGTDAPSELDQRRILQAVETALFSAGLLVRDDRADLIVVTHAVVGTQSKTKGGGMGVSLFKSTGWGGLSVSGGGGRSKQVPVGTLGVQLIDAASGTLVWEGIARDALGGNPSKSEARITKAVDRMFRKYPQEADDKKKKKKG